MPLAGSPELDAGGVAFLFGGGARFFGGVSKEIKKNPFWGNPVFFDFFGGGNPLFSGFRGSQQENHPLFGAPKKADPNGEPNE